jgi:hypothetical protein
MDTFVTLALAAAWTAIIAMLFWGVAVAWRNVMSQTGVLPFFRMVERRGVSLAELEHRPGDLGRALRRCTNCSERSSCDAWLAGGGRAPSCPNGAYLDNAARA